MLNIPPDSSLGTVLTTTTETPALDRTEPIAPVKADISSDAEEASSVLNIKSKPPTFVKLNVRVISTTASFRSNKVLQRASSSLTLLQRKKRKKENPQEKGAGLSRLK